MPPIKDLTGQRFGRLTVVEMTHKDKHGYWWWRCKCDCGNETVTNGAYLRNGDTRSCGCLHRDELSEMRRKHGGSASRLYRVWQNMKERCSNPNNTRYKDYGGRGIAVCSEWETNFLSFSKWAFDNGYNETAPYGLCTIDRIDVNGDYEPNNCRVVALKQQANNTRRNHILVVDGIAHTLSEWADISGIPYKALSQRIRRGWDANAAVTTPLTKG